jgi:hypothetical protein
VEVQQQWQSVGRSATQPPPDDDEAERRRALTEFYGHQLTG